VPASSSFPATVAGFLREHGWEVDEQVGASAFRIDLGVRRHDGDGYLLAIECDGPAYAAQRTVRDRDELRASVLKGLGWYVTRIWSVDWALDRKRAEESLLGLLDALETSAPGGAQLAATASTGGSQLVATASSLPPGVTAVRPSSARHKPPVKRAIDTIPPDELAQAMREVETDFGVCERDALYRETLKRFGLTVLTPKARTHLDAAFRRK
jgi:very-short-patch-repair endonuclease